MQLYIPRLGDIIRLTQDWAFDLYNEDRNSSMMKQVADTRDIGRSWNNTLTSIRAIVPAGEQLKIDRIFIRKGAAEFDSVTFFWVGKRIPGYSETRDIPASGSPGTYYYRPARTVVDKYPAQPVRFWAKMDDVNTIHFEPV
jgi:hypothetical protein